MESAQVSPQDGAFSKGRSAGERSGAGRFGSERREMDALRDRSDTSLTRSGSRTAPRETPSGDRQSGSSWQPVFIPITDLMGVKSGQ